MNATVCHNTDAATCFSFSPVFLRLQEVHCGHGDGDGKAPTMLSSVWLWWVRSWWYPSNKKQNDAYFELSHHRVFHQVLSLSFCAKFISIENLVLTNSQICLNWVIMSHCSRLFTLNALTLLFLDITGRFLQWKSIKILLHSPCAEPRTRAVVSISS